MNSTSGPLLARADGPSFSTNVVIPDKAIARTYYIVGVQRAADGSIVRDGAVAFTVTGAEAPAGDPPPPSNPQDNAATNPQPGPEPAAGSAEPAPASTEAPAATTAPVPAATAAPAPAGPVADASRARSTSKTAKGTDGGPPSGPPGEDPGQPPAGPSDGAAEQASQPVAVAEPSGSLHSISSDVWSGFASPQLVRCGRPQPHRLTGHQQGG